MFSVKLYPKLILLISIDWVDTEEKSISTIFQFLLVPGSIYDGARLSIAVIVAEENG